MKEKFTPESVSPASVEVITSDADITDPSSAVKRKDSGNTRGSGIPDEEIVQNP